MEEPDSQWTDMPGTREPFGPPLEPMPLWIFAGGIVAAVALTSAFLGPSTPKVSKPEPTRISQRVQPMPFTVAAPTHDMRSMDTPPAKLVVKCVEHGHVTYSEPAACRGFSTELSLAGIPLIGTVGPTDYDDYLLQSADARAMSVERSSGTAPAVIGRIAPGSSASCGYLEQQVRMLDAEARNALPMSEQDRIRAARQAATAQQYSLGC